MGCTVDVCAFVKQNCSAERGSNRRGGLKCPSILMIDMNYQQPDAHSRRTAKSRIVAITLRRDERLGLNEGHPALNMPLRTPQFFWTSQMERRAVACAQAIPF
jgi:hypothetical protein